MLHIVLASITFLPLTFASLIVYTTNVGTAMQLRIEK